MGTIIMKEQMSMAKKTNTTNAMNITKNADRPVTQEEVYANQEVIMNVAKRRGWDHDSCKDLVQEVAIKCYTNQRIRFNPEKGTLAGFLARLARNTAVDMYRKNKKYIKDTDYMDDAELARVESEGKMEDKELNDYRWDLLRRGIRELCRRYPSKPGYDAFIMTWIEGMSGKKIAEKIGKAPSFAHVASHRGVARLKKIVRQLERDDDWRDAS